MTIRVSSLVTAHEIINNYILQKGNHFKANAFVKAVNNAHLKGKDYDDAVDRWLKANAKKYDYKYEFRKCQDELKTL